MQESGSDGLAQAVERLERSLEDLSKDVASLRAELRKLETVVAASGTALANKVDELGRRLEHR